MHAFTPAELCSQARAAGFEDVRVSGEELAASLFGWANRTLEASADPLDVPWAWRVYAYRGYLLLQTLDRSLLEPRLPAALFYNLLLSARVPDLDQGASSAGFSLKNPCGRSEKPTVSRVMTGYCSTAASCVWPTVYQTTRSRPSTGARSRTSSGPRPPGPWFG